MLSRSRMSDSRSPSRQASQVAGRKAGSIFTRLTLSFPVFTGALLLGGFLFAQKPANLFSFRFLPGALVVSRVQYDGNTFSDPTPYPYIFSESTVSGVQGSIHLDQYLAVPHSPQIGSLALPSGASGITTSFSSKSEGSLSLSPNGQYLTYMGYAGPDGSEGVSNSYDTGAGTNLQPPVTPAYDREVALIGANASVTLQAESNAYSGDNPRGAITTDGTTLYMAGNSDSTTYSGGTTGPGLTIGARLGQIGSSVSVELGVYTAADRPDESKKQHIKDSNFRGIGIYNGNLYVSKGSGGNGDDGVFQVENGKGNGLPTGTGNTIVKLFGAPATDPVTSAVSPLTPFGFWFAPSPATPGAAAKGSPAIVVTNPTTVYVADEGYANFDGSGDFIPDPMAGLEKWSLVNGTWQLLYTIQAGLNLYQPQTVPGYPVTTYTTGIRNMTAKVNGDGTVTIYAITGQYSTISGGEPDPTRLVAVTDTLSATTLPAGEQFVTYQQSPAGQVFRGVAFAPQAPKP